MIFIFIKIALPIAIIRYMAIRIKNLTSAKKQIIIQNIDFFIDNYQILKYA